MQSSVAVIGIIIEDKSSIEALNHIISEYSEYVIGRMGIPYHSKNMNIISIKPASPKQNHIEFWSMP